MTYRTCDIRGCTRPFSGSVITLEDEGSRDLWLCGSCRLELDMGAALEMEDTGERLLMSNDDDIILLPAKGHHLNA